MQDILSEILNSDNFDEDSTVEAPAVNHKLGRPSVISGGSFDNYGSSLEDRFGQELWIRTRECFCPDNAETDCRFHSPQEPGWEQCPSTGSKNIGRWLFAKNSNYGKSPPKEEKAE